MTILETGRLILRTLTEDDFDNLCTILQDEKAMYAYEHAFSNEEVSAWLQNQLDRCRENGFGLYAVLLKPEGIFIGQAGITMQPLNGETVPEIGYLFQRKHWNRGYATEAAIALKNYAYETLGLSKIYSIIRDSNITSQKVAVKNGMNPVCMITKHYYDMDMPHIVYCAEKGLT